MSLEAGSRSGVAAAASARLRAGASARVVGDRKRMLSHRVHREHREEKRKGVLNVRVVWSGWWFMNGFLVAESVSGGVTGCHAVSTRFGGRRRRACER